MRSAWALAWIVFAVGCLDRNSADDDSEPPAVCGNGQLESGEQCDDGNTTSGDGCSAGCGREASVDVTYRLASVAGDPAACPAGTDTAVVTIQAYHTPASCIDPAVCDDVLDGSPIVLTGPCAAGEVKQWMAPRSYHVVVQLVAAATGAVYATSLVEHTSPSGGTTNITILSDGGYARLMWDWYDDATNQGWSGCIIPAGAIYVSITPTSGGTATSATYACTDWHATIALAAGSYDVSLSGSPWQGGPLGMAAPMTGVAIAAPNELTPLFGEIHYSGPGP